MLRRSTTALLFAALACAGCTKKRQNRPPTVNVSLPPQVAIGDTVVAHSNASDPDNDPLTYAWKLDAVPNGSALTPSDLHNADKADAFFIPDVEGAYAVSVSVSDGAGHTVAGSGSTLVKKPDNRPPLVSAGAGASTCTGGAVVLTGAAADPDGDPMTYAWAVVSAPAGSAVTTASLSGAATLTAGFTPDVDGDYVLSFTATDTSAAATSAQVKVTAATPAAIAGTVTVKVTSAADGAPLAGVTVWVGDGTSASATTGADGSATLAPVAAGPVDVSASSAETVQVDDDFDPATPPVTRPRYRNATVLAASSAAVAIALKPTEEAVLAAPSGHVKGRVPASLYDALKPASFTESPGCATDRCDLTKCTPWIEPFFSLGDPHISGQMRVVLVAPLVKDASLTDLEVSSFLAPAVNPDVPFPGNFTTDDCFLNQNASSFGMPPDPNGQPFTLVDFKAPAGKQTFFVLGGVITADMNVFLPILSSVITKTLDSGGLEIGTLLGSMRLDVLGFGLVTVDVPAGGEVDISSALDPAKLDYWKRYDVDDAENDVVVTAGTGGCAQNITFYTRQFFPKSTVTAELGGAPPDPRLAAAAAAVSTAPATVLCPDASSSCNPPKPCTTTDPQGTGWVRQVSVPQPVTSEVPFGLAVLAGEVPAGTALPSGATVGDGGLAVLGFGFHHSTQVDKKELAFFTPPSDPVTGALHLSAADLWLRRLKGSPLDGRFAPPPGRIGTAAPEVLPVGTATVAAEPALPAVSSPPDPGVAPHIVFTLQDPTVDPPVAASARGLVDGVNDGAGSPLSCAPAADGAELRLVTLQELESVTKSTSSGNVTVEVPWSRWDLYAPGGATTVALPGHPAGVTLPAPGTPGRVLVRGVTLSRPACYGLFDPATVDAARLSESSDAYGVTW